MQYTIPDYYNEFSCVAGACPDTCCAGWQIVIDENSKKKYKKYPGDFGERLKHSVDWKEGTFYQNNKRCAFLNQDNLCDLYKEAGEHMLCDTCRKYPRHVEEYEDLREISLSLSCPVVAHMIVERQEKITFLTKERSMRPEEYEEFDYMLFTKLCDARELMFSVIQERRYDIRTRIAMVLSLGHDLQRRISNGQLFEVDELLGRYGSPDAVGRFEKRCEKYRGCVTECDETMLHMFGLFDEMETLKDDFPEFLKTRMNRKYSYDISQQEAVCLEQFIVYFLYTYFCGAVYDRQAYGKVKFAVVSALLIRRIYCGDVRSADGYNSQAATEAAYRYSKEVEHSDINLLRMEELLLQKSEFGIESLMKVIWGQE